MASHDLDVLAVSFDARLGAGSAFDLCLAWYRDVPPLAVARSGGYTEAFCVVPWYFADAGTYQQTLDFHTTPLFLPAGTKFSCGGSWGTSAPNSGPRGCRVTVRANRPGTRRFRVLRIPHLDLVVAAGDGFATSHYQGTPNHPLEVHGYVPYTALQGDWRHCLQHVDGVNGVPIAEACTPLKRRSFLANDDPEGVIPVRWSIHAPNLVSARVDVSFWERDGGWLPGLLFDRGRPLDWDFAAYVIVEVPEDLVPSAEIPFRDYGQVVPSLLQDWCRYYVTAPDGGRPPILPSQALQLCDYQAACVPDAGALLRQCVDTFAPATCLSTAACFADGGAP